MKLSFSDEAWDDYLFWQSDKAALRRINTILKDIKRDPFVGIGKPEPLKGNYSNYWSRRIDEKNRIVYRVEQNTVEVIQCRDHY